MTTIHYKGEKCRRCDVEEHKKSNKSYSKRDKKTGVKEKAMEIDGLSKLCTTFVNCSTVALERS